MKEKHTRKTKREKINNSLINEKMTYLNHISGVEVSFTFSSFIFS